MRTIVTHIHRDKTSTVLSNWLSSAKFIIDIIHVVLTHSGMQHSVSYSVMLVYLTDLISEAFKLLLFYCYDSNASRILLSICVSTALCRPFCRTVS